MDHTATLPKGPFEGTVEPAPITPERLEEIRIAFNDPSFSFSSLTDDEVYHYLGGQRESDPRLLKGIWYEYTEEGKLVVTIPPGANVDLYEDGSQEPLVEGSLPVPHIEPHRLAEIQNKIAKGAFDPRTLSDDEFIHAYGLQRPTDRRMFSGFLYCFDNGQPRQVA